LGSRRRNDGWGRKKIGIRQREKAFAALSISISVFPPVLFEIVFSGRVPIVLSCAWFGQLVPALFPNSTRFSANVLRFFSSCSGLPAPSPLGVILDPAHHVRLCGKNKERFCHNAPIMRPRCRPLGVRAKSQNGRALAARKTGLSKAKASITNTGAGKSLLGGQRERRVVVGSVPGDVLLGVSVRFG
jgi:hypothetical protein